MKTVLITGGSGLIGKHLAHKLLKKGYNVTVLSRIKSKKSELKTYQWNFNENKIEKESIATADYIIHLAGANIAEKRWTLKRKNEIINSRVKTTELIYNTIKELNKPIKAFISASAVGFYGAVTVDKIFTENDNPANDFLGKTCLEWERSTSKFIDLGIRTVKIRTGVVLSTKGGALPKMALPIKLGIGSAIGSGKQYIPWIHIDDLCDIYIKAIEDENIIGAINAVAPEHKNNKEFTKEIAKTLNKAFWFPNIPSVTMKILFGEMSEILLTGSRISSNKIISLGYKFNFPSLKTALNDLFY